MHSYIECNAVPHPQKMTINNSTDSGCGCFTLIVLAAVFVLFKCFSDKPTCTNNYLSTNNTYEPYISEEDTSTIIFYDEQLIEENKKYMNNSLSTGAKPYKEYYGNGYDCPYIQCSVIRVTAPKESDIVVVIKQNNQNGKVVQHGYIKKGDTYQFDVPDGIYQTFFYYGKGWNPNQIMKDGLKGGFVKDEIFSKDNPQVIESGILEYVLQLRKDGNFQTKSSDKSEMF